MTRGLVLGLSLEQIAARADSLGSPDFTAGYYQLSPHNGGKDPTAADPFDRWQFTGEHDGLQHEAITGDCIGAAAWNGGFDRWQPLRFAHIYDGWINTDSMLIDANGPKKCFVPLAEPERGCFLVAPTGSPGFHACGHIITVTEIATGLWDPDDLACWKGMLGVDVALRGSSRANTLHDCTWWFAARHHGAKFVRSIMTP